MADLAEAYLETHDHLVEIASSLTDDELGTIVPASPAWTVRDVVAHVSGLATDLVTGAFPADLIIAASLVDPDQARRRDAMTAEQVAARRGRTLGEVAAEWTVALDSLLPMLRGERPFPNPGPFLDSVLVTDLAVHAQDVRGALGRPGDRESAGVGIALASYAAALGTRVRAAGLGAIRLRYGAKERVAGSGEPVATMAAERYEVFRALAGRRSTDQIRAFDWKGDPEPYQPLIPAYGPRNDPLVE